MNQLSIRNFAIVAYVDHGKSTLADRFLEITGTVQKGKARMQKIGKVEIPQKALFSIIES